MPLNSVTIILNGIVSIVLFCIQSTESKAIALTEENFDKYISSHNLVFLNFYADWCRFSQILSPIFDEAADKLTQEFNPGQVLLAKVDAVQQDSLASRFKISKYPTLKLIRNGKLVKREFRGQRSLDAITEYIRELLKDPVIEVETEEDLQKIDANKRALIIYMPEKSQIYDNFLRVALDLREDCKSYFVKGSLATANLPEGETTKILFKPAKAKAGDEGEEYNGAILSYDELSAWATNRCIPLVREITFENAEELTEEALPFLILFHHPDDSESPKLFTQQIKNNLLDARAMVNFLVADGLQFAHPLHHLGKTQKDLPLIAIDSFRHMYLFPNFQDMHVPGKLKDFIGDLFSGKLHREFHYGADPVTNEQIISTNPPESTFKKLLPSSNRYTILKDEL